MAERLLDVKNLKVSFFTYAGEVQAVRGIDFHVDEGETLAIVGESGCGKSVTVNSIMKLIPSPPGKIKEGSIMLDGRDITNLDEKEMNEVRGSQIGMIFQDPMTSLNPTMTISQQIMEGIMRHRNMSRKEAYEEAIRILELVEIPNARKRANSYPHEFSGGMRQRVIIAIAIACDPMLLIADEPTTALDVTIQAQILDLMKAIQRNTGTSIILITHDLGVVADIADRVNVMYAGEIVETGTLREIFYEARHPYTWGLLESVPRLDMAEDVPLIPIAGTPPDLLNPPKGCPFADRCRHAMVICKEQHPGFKSCSETHGVSCWLTHPDAPKIERPLGGMRSE